MIRSFDPEVIKEAMEPYPEMNDLNADWAEFLEDTNNIMFVEGDSVGVLTYNYPGCYTGHYFFKVGGKEAFDLCRRMVREAIEKHGAQLFRGLTPVDNRKALIFNRRLGMTSYGLVELSRGPHELFCMTAEDFIKRNN